MNKNENCVIANSRSKEVKNQTTSPALEKKLSIFYGGLSGILHKSALKSLTVHRTIYGIN
jgi:hypothetical protein